MSNHFEYFLSSSLKLKSWPSVSFILKMMSSISGGKWVPMLGNIPDCTQVPIVRNQNINILADWRRKKQIQFLAMALLAESLNVKFTLYDLNSKALIVTFHHSYILPLTKHPPIYIVSN